MNDTYELTLPKAATSARHGEFVEADNIPLQTPAVRLFASSPATWSELVGVLVLQPTLAPTRVRGLLVPLENANVPADGKYCKRSQKSSAQ